MRLDKYLKVSRIIKRRTIAKEVCDAGRVKVNQRVARASYEVKTNDEIEVQMGSKPIKIRVTEINEHTTKSNASDNYIIIE